MEDVDADVGEAMEDDPGEGWERLLGEVSWGTYITTDDAPITTDVADDDWEAALVAKARGQVGENSDNDNEPEDHPLTTAKDGL